MPHPSSRFARPPLRPQRGFTLIEMLIAITIGLGILAGLVGVLASNAGNSRSNDRTSELMTNGRYALNSIRNELREAGFRGYTWAEPDAPALAGALTNECLQAGAGAGSFVSNIRQGVWGANNANPFTANCIPAAEFAAGSDVLVVRRLDVLPSAALAANTVYFRTSYAQGQVYRATTAPVVPPTLAPGAAPLADFAVRAYVYYVSPFTVSAAESPQIPALKRVALLADGSMARELVASGIERMQVQYGRLTTALDMQYLDTLGGSSFDTAITAWDDVNAVRIWLLARSTTSEPGYQNTLTYPMGDQPLTANDNLRRQMFSAIVQLRN